VGGVLGELEGTFVGVSDGDGEGAGDSVGDAVGLSVGLAVTVGAIVGVSDGEGDGAGDSVGASVVAVILGSKTARPSTSSRSLFSDCSKDGRLSIKKDGSSHAFAVETSKHNKIRLLLRAGAIMVSLLRLAFSYLVSEQQNLGFLVKK
jgi:hypothetical protein